MRRRHFILTLGFGVVALLGYWLAGTATTPTPLGRESPKIDPAPKRSVLVDEPAPKFRRGDRGPPYRRDEEATIAGALPGQRILIFKTQAALEAFLKRAGNKVRLLARLDALNALRIGFGDFDLVAGLLSGDESESFVFPVDIPPLAEGTAQADAVGMGAGLLEWLGVEVDNSAWGSGVKIAVLDTGVASSPAFSSQISTTNLVDLLSDPNLQNGHGTAVASLIIGNSALTPGVAPGAEILSFRIANDFGQSDSFLLADGIVQAVDAGAQLINISMGSVGDSELVRKAIAYAQAAGTVIFAAAGNNGQDGVSFPAANEGVIAVGTVDKLGNHVDFSNTGQEIAIAAPGFEVNAAWTAGRAATVSGTSFSTPVVAGSIAALMSRPGVPPLTAQQAMALLFSHLNDSGSAGEDVAVGGGMPDLGRAIAGNTPGIYDAAIASQNFVPPSAGFPNGQIEVVVQNRGTEILVNTNLQISTPSGNVNSNITSLAPIAVRVIRIPISHAPTEALRYDSVVSISRGMSDLKTSNDRRGDTYVPAGKR